MARWTVRIPHRDRGDSLVDVAAACRALPYEERAVTRQIVMEAELKGLTSAGQLIDHVAALSREQRRELIDRARAELGLPSTEQVDHDEWEARTRRSRLGNFPVMESDLPPHLRGLGLGE
jgi:hypothetical protein